MHYRTHREAQLSEIGMGCYAAGGAYGPVDVASFKHVIDRACGLGVTFFDTAEAYGDAEPLLGEALKPHRHRVWVATKVGVKEGSRPNLHPDYIHQACDRSLAALQMDHIDLYQVHFDDPDTPPAETVGALEELKAAGKIRHYGLGHLPRERAEAYVAAGEVFSILMELSAVTRDVAAALLPLCREHGVGAIAFSVTGRGVLTGAIDEQTRFPAGDIRRIDPLFQRERLRSALRVTAKMARIARARHLTPAQVAIAWVLAQPGIVCALTGPRSVVHLEENIAASGVRLNANELRDIEQLLEREAASLRGEQLASLRRILAQRRLPATEATFTDLVYVVETALQLGLTTESEILPLFHELYALRHDLPAAGPALDRIRERLAAALPLLADES